MGDIEKLIKLKRIYEDLIDLKENGNVKISSKVINDLAKEYRMIWQKIAEEEPMSIYYEKGIKIGSDIYIDYENDNQEALASGDVGHEWWN